MENSFLISYYDYSIASEILVRFDHNGAQISADTVAMDFTVFAYVENNIAHLITFNQILVDLDHYLRIGMDHQYDEGGALVARDTLIADTIFYLNTFSSYAANYSEGIFTLVSPLFDIMEERYEITVIRRIGDEITIGEPWIITPPDNGYSFSWGVGSTPDGRGVLSAFEWSQNPSLKFWGFDEIGFATGLEHAISVGEGQQVNGVTMKVHEGFIYTAYTEVTENIGEPAGGAWLSGFSLDEVMDSDDPAPVIPESYNFSAYPNPFNPVANIRFDLVKSQRVKLSVFDVTGRLVTTLLDEHRSHGTHAIPFDGTNLSTGIYFARLQADNFSQTTKLVLLK